MTLLDLIFPICRIGCQQHLNRQLIILPQKAGKKVKILNEGASGSAMRNVTFVMVFDEGQINEEKRRVIPQTSLSGRD